jgi:hypothetical protein
MGQPNGTMRHGAGGSPMRLPALVPAARADPIAAALLLIAGAIGGWQLLLPWRTASIAQGAATGDAGSTTGWQVYRALRAIPDPNGYLQAATYSVLWVAVGGGALIVLGLTMMLAINHRPLGLAALTVSLLSVMAAGWLLVRARAIFDVGLFSLFAQAEVGWYLFLGAGLLGIVGSWKALVTG